MRTARLAATCLGALRCVEAAFIVILDTLSGLAGLIGDDENSAGPVNAVLRPVLRIAGSGASVLLLHHLSKDTKRKGVGRFRGSGALVAQVDAAITLDAVGAVGSRERILRTEKGRGPGWVENVRYTLRKHSSGAGLRYMFDRLQSADADDQMQGEIERVLTATPGLCMADVEARVEGKTSRKRAAVQRLQELGRLCVEPGAHGAKRLYLAPPRPTGGGEIGGVGPEELAPPPLEGGNGGRATSPGPGTASPQLAPPGGASSARPEGARP